MERAPSAPLILSLAIDERAFAFFDGLRRAHFPPERNVLSAHLTLFHKLPPEHESRIVADIEAECVAQPPMRLAASGVILLGGGVAYALAGPALVRVRELLAARWAPWLTAQDCQRFRPHVTVQNKVTPARARALFDELHATFSPFEVIGEGLLLWRYQGGPWEAAGSFPFRGPNVETCFAR